MISAANGADRALTVLMTADAVGGVWHYALSLCRSLPEIRFILVTMGPRPVEGQRDTVRSLQNVVLVESDHHLEWMADAEAGFEQSLGWLSELIQSYDVDLVHVNGYAHARLGSDLPALAVAHSDVLSWWEAVYKRPAPAEWNEYRKRVAEGLAAATRIVAPTAAVLADLGRHYGPLASPASLIRNGIKLAAFRPLVKRRVVLSAGRLWDAAKNIAALALAAPGLTWPVEVVGDLEHPEGGVAAYPGLRLLGPLSPADMARRLGQASIYAAPARYEPFGLSILEAAAAGCALVLGDIASLRENWECAAVFVDPERPSDLNAAIAALIAEPGRRARLAAAARRRARSFALGRMARAYSALYKEMMWGSARREAA